MTGKLSGIAQCPLCNGTGDPQDWSPGPDLDPMMRQFKCRSYRTIFYYVLPNTDQLIKVDQAIVKARRMV